MQPTRLVISPGPARAQAPFIRRHLLAAIDLLNESKPLALEELSVAFVGDRVMAELHERFLGIPGPTDVLTFPLESSADGRVSGGEVVVCVDEARRQATAGGIEFRKELLLYTLHGLLHLLGFDDRTARSFAAMHRQEDALLKQLGIGAVFRPARRTVRRRD